MVGNHTEQDGTHLGVGSFALLALLVGVDRSSATWDDPVHAWVRYKSGGLTCCVCDFVAEEEEDWEDGDNITIWK